MKVSLLFLLILSLPDLTLAELSLAPVFSDGMVLQRDREIPIWGMAGAAEQVTVTFGNTTEQAVAAQDGRWRLTLPARAADISGGTLEITSGGDRVEVGDVLIGDVWLCSGQSNMEFKLKNCRGGKSDAKSAADPLIRVSDFRQPWEVCRGKIAESTSGVAYYFAQARREAEPNVPVGLLIRALGGSPIEHWTPVDALAGMPIAKANLERFSSDREEGKAWLEFSDAEDAYKQARHKGENIGTRPKFEGSSTDSVLAGIYAGDLPGRLYRERIVPLAGYGIAGALWYQGECNTKGGTELATNYEMSLSAMVSAWRDAWGLGDFRFLIVQLPTYAKGGPNWAVVQEAQAKAGENISNAATIDIRDLPDGGLHPNNKRPVGERLAAVAKP